MADEVAPAGGPWGAVMDVILCLLPLVFLVLTTLVAQIRLPTSTSLPAAAFMMWLVRLAYLATPPNFTNAAVIFGLFDALTPMSISGGAILLFAAMEATQCMPWIMVRLKGLSQGHPVAEVFLIMWAFEYLIEGASGFGTPVALAAPMMGQLGHSPFRSVVCALIMNTLATPFGGVGTPIWFGFSGLVPPEDEQLFFTTIAWKTQLIMTILAHFVPVLGAMFLVPFPILRRNWLFILLSVWSCVLPAFALSFFSYEFPSLLGGLVGVCITGVLAKFKVGLHPNLTEMDEMRAKHEAEEAEPDEVDKIGSERSFAHSLGDAAASGRLQESFLGRSFYPRGADFATAFDPTSHPMGKNIGRPCDSIGIQATRGPEQEDLDSEESIHKHQHFSNRQTAVSTSQGDAAPAPSSAPAASGVSPFDVEAPGTSVSVSAVKLSETNGKDNVNGEDAKDSGDKGGNGFLSAIGRTFPLWGTVLILIITRVPQFQIKTYLRLKEPYFQINFGSLFKFRLSASIVFQLVDILTEPISWSYEFLYVPSFIPFILISSIAVAMYHKDVLATGQKWFDCYNLTLNRVSYIVIPLLGALTLVSLIRNTELDNQSPAYIIGYELSAALRQGWLAFICFIGALGSFFSGSTTTSNLTFGKVNVIAAENLGLDPTGLLAMQCVGATLGNCICINNIISAKTVVGLISTPEGAFIAKTGLVCLIAIVAGTALGSLFVYTLPASI